MKCLGILGTVSFCSVAVLSGTVTTARGGYSGGYGVLAAHFEPNDAGFEARIRGGVLRLSAGEAVWRSAGGNVWMVFAGANPPAVPEGFDRLPGSSTYLLGEDRRTWRTGVPHYGQIRYRQIYPGIDALFRAAGGSAEYEFLVRPGADPARIRLIFAGHRGLRLDPLGDLRLRTAEGELRHYRPVAYQDLDGRRRLIPSRFVRTGRNQIGFSIGAYDATRPLIIDPVLSYSTYVGGVGDDSVYAIAIDAAGNAYIAGSFARGGGSATPDAFIAKLNPAGTALLFMTFLGGAGADSATGIALDASGNVYVGGSTRSQDFPTTPGAFRTAGTGRDAFAAKLDPSGKNLIYSTYLGPAEGGGIAVDAAGSAYLCGYTFSPDFPTTPGAYQTVPKGGDQTFIVKLRSDGRPAYATLLGGSSGAEAGAIAVDPLGNAYVAGGTRSSDFPVTPGAFQTAKGAGNSEDAFVTKLNAQGSGLVYSTYLGGSSPEGAFAIALDSTGSAYVTGITMSSDFPVTARAYASKLSGSEDAFVSRLSPDGTRLEYSTYLGGSIGAAIAVDSSREAVVAGTTRSDFAVTPDAILRSVPAEQKMFVAMLNADGTALRFGTLFGGTQAAYAGGVAIDNAHSIYVAGTAGQNHPVTPGAAQTAPGSIEGYDGFVSKIVAAGPGPTAIGLVSAASHLPYTAVAPDSIASVFGSNLAVGIEHAQLPLPTSLAGATVLVKDSAGVERSAPLFYASPGQINFLVPEGTTTGAASVTISNGGQAAGIGAIEISAVGPALFSAAASGRGVAAGYVVKVAADGSQTQEFLAECGGSPPACTAKPVEWSPGVQEMILVLFGTGIRGRNPSEPVRANTYGIELEVLYAGPQNQFIGLDQVNVRLPAGDSRFHGELPLELIVGGRRSNSVTFSVK